MQNIFQEFEPDILETMSNLSSDEVFTPPEIANKVLDTLPIDIWENPDIKILDPCSKSGVFLREAAKRLMKGLELKIPDEKKRREHIFKEMLFGISITELTSLISRRSLYYSKDASNDESVVKFKEKEGNILYQRADHEFVANKCKICGAVKTNIDRGEELENYAYEFIHDNKIFSDMRFDVIVGNPPYQLDDDGYGRSAKAIYHLFVEQAFKLRPGYVAMVIPSRWFIGGKVPSQFRKRMLSSKQFRNLVDYEDSSEVFPNVTIRGGVCYFLYDKHYEGKCKVENYKEGKITSTSERYLGEFGDVFIRHSEALSIISKVQKKANSFMNEQVSTRNAFGMQSNFWNYSENKKHGHYKLYFKGGGEGWVHPKFVTKNNDWVHMYKVLSLAAYGTSGSKPYQVTSRPKVVSPGSVSTETYLVCGVYDSLEKAEALETYLKTKFVRFLIYLRVITQHIKPDSFSFVPVPDLTKSWDDKKLYKEYSLTDEEIEFIEDHIRPIEDE